MRVTKLSKLELLKRLADCAKPSDTEAAHGEADALLLEYINDEDIRAAYDAIDKWYA